MSSPMMNTRASRRISSRMASFNAWVMVMERVCTCVCAIPHLLYTPFLLQRNGLGKHVLKQLCRVRIGALTRKRHSFFDLLRDLGLELVDLGLGGETLGEQQLRVDADGVALLPLCEFFLGAVGSPDNTAQTQGV